MSMNVPAVANDNTYVTLLHASATQKTLRKREKDILGLLTKPLPQASKTKPAPSYYMAGVGTRKIASVDNDSDHKCIFMKGFLDVKRLEAIRQMDSIDSCEKQESIVEVGSGEMSDYSYTLTK